jgi:hypothetical protein
MHDLDEAANLVRADDEVVYGDAGAGEDAPSAVAGSVRRLGATRALKAWKCLSFLGF